MISTPTLARSKPRTPVLQRSHRLAQGLVGAWLFTERGGTTLRDYSGLANHGTLTNMDPATDWVAGEKGVALDFDGTDDQVELALGALPNSAPLTIHAVAKQSSSHAGGCICIGGEDASQVHGFGLLFVGTAAWALTQNVTNTQAVSGSLILNQFYSLCAVFTSPTDRKIYVNGVVAGEDTTSKTPNISYVSRCRIGQRANNVNDQNFHGSIENAAIWNRALSANEIAELYRDPWGMWTPRSYWPVTEQAAGVFSPFWASQATKITGVL